MEQRYFGLELRADEQSIRGTAAVFYDGTPATEFQLWDGAVERILPSAFSLEDDDVLALWNHSLDHVLGRTPNTLKLSISKRGLEYEISPNMEQQVTRELVSMIRRGDIRGSSFGGIFTKTSWKKEGEKDVREVRSVKLRDVSPVTVPAYSGTQTYLRSSELEEIRSDWKKWQRQLETEKRLNSL